MRIGGSLGLSDLVHGLEMLRVLYHEYHVSNWQGRAEEGMKRIKSATFAMQASSRYPTREKLGVCLSFGACGLQGLRFRVFRFRI